MIKDGVFGGSQIVPVGHTRRWHGHPGATKTTTGVMFEACQVVLERLGSLRKRPRTPWSIIASRIPPRLYSAEACRSEGACVDERAMHSGAFNARGDADNVCNSSACWFGWRPWRCSRLGLKLAPMLTRTMVVLMRPVAMLMIGMMLTLRVTRAYRRSGC